MTPDLLVLVPGIMGSELVDSQSKKLVWGLHPSLLRSWPTRRLKRLRFERTDDGDLRLDDGIVPGRPIRYPGWLPFLNGIEPYERLVDHLHANALRPDAVFEFGYDWRKPIDYNAQLLERAVKDRLDSWRSVFMHLPLSERREVEPRVTFICHSMGGLVARWYAGFLDHEQVTRRILTFGTPYGGAVKAVRMLAGGDTLPFGILAKSLRRTARTMPGIYDLLPTYKAFGDRNPQAPSVEAIVSTAKEGKIDRKLVEASLGRAAKVLKPRYGLPEMRMIVGVNQRTLLSWSNAGSEASFFDTLDGAHLAGDGTVYQGAAFLKGHVPNTYLPSYLPQSHGALARTYEVAGIVKAVLDEDEVRAYQGHEGPGLIVPNAARVGETIELEVERWDGDASILIEDLSKHPPVEVMELAPHVRGGRLVSSATIVSAGLYRVKLAAGSFSDVTELMWVSERTSQA